MLVIVLKIPTCHRATTTSAGVRWSPTLGWSRRPTASRARTTGTGWSPWASGTRTTWGRRASPRSPGCSVSMSSTQGERRMSGRFETLRDSSDSILSATKTTLPCWDSMKAWNGARTSGRFVFLNQWRKPIKVSLSRKPSLSASPPLLLKVRQAGWLAGGRCLRGGPSPPWWRKSTSPSWPTRPARRSSRRPATGRRSRTPWCAPDTATGGRTHVTVTQNKIEKKCMKTIYI